MVRETRLILDVGPGNAVQVREAKVPCRRSDAQRKRIDQLGSRAPYETDLTGAVPARVRCFEIQRDELQRSRET